MDVSLRMRERAYQLWEQEERPKGRHLHHWLQAERELVAEHALDLEFKQLMLDFRSGIINQNTVEQLMNDLEKRALAIHKGVRSYPSTLGISGNSAA